MCAFLTSYGLSYFYPIFNDRLLDIFLNSASKTQWRKLASTIVLLSVSFIRRLFNITKFHYYYYYHYISFRCQNCLKYSLFQENKRLTFFNLISSQTFCVMIILLRSWVQIWITHTLITCIAFMHFKSLLIKIHVNVVIWNLGC